MLRILHVTPYYAPAWSYGGVVSAVKGLAEAQASQGHHVTILTTDADSPTSRNPIRHETLSGVEVVRCRNVSNAIRWRYNLSQPPGLRSAFMRLVPDIDVIHVHELRTVENLLAMLFTRHERPVVLSPHGTLSHHTGRSAMKRGWDTLFSRGLLRRIDHVAALTDTEAQEARALWESLHVPFPGATIIPNGVATDFSQQVTGNLRPRYGLGDGPLVLFLGRLHERKGLQFLIPAFALAARDIPGAHLLVVGPDEGMLATAKALADQYGIASRVTFTGLLQGADQRAALASADLFVLPAVGEGLSMSALEAMAAGLPLILTPGCNLPDVESRGAGLLVEREIEPLAVALRMLLSDPARRRAMGDRGRAWIAESFTWPIVAAQAEALYRHLIEGRRPTFIS